MKNADPSVSLEDVTLVTKLLEELGYQLRWKGAGRAECIASGHDEMWSAHGVKQEDAIQMLVAKMFPSQGARDLLIQQMGVLAVSRTQTPASLPQALQPRAVVSTSPSPPKAPEAPAPVAPKPPTPPAAPKSPAAPKPPVPPAPPKPIPPPRAVQPTMRAPEKETPSDPTLSLAEGLEVIRDIAAEIDDEETDLAMMSAFLQKAHISKWIFRAREVQVRLKNVRDVEEAVHRIAQRLMGLCRIFWPGSVRALQVDAAPAVGLSDLMHNPPRVSSWGDAARAVEDLLDRIPSGSDEYGWKDTAALRPPPQNPETVLREAVDKIEKVLGPLEESYETRGRRVSAEHIRDNEEVLILAAHLLRWVRLSTASRMKWGRAMGAMRWASRTSNSDAIWRLISEEFCPAKPLAELLGRDPNVNKLQRARKQTMENVPAPGGLQEHLLDWLRVAFEAFTNPQIAKMALSVRGEIMELTNEDFSDADRNVRSRLRRLQTVFRTSQDLSQVTLPDVSGVSEQEESKEGPAEKEDVGAVLLQRVRKFTEGKKMLFVTNRDDEPLRIRLERDLHCSVTLKDGTNNRKLQALLAGVSTYDLVLMATGFTNHGTSVALGKAAKDANIPYIRVNKGRPLATVRALARAFNVDDGDDPAN